MKEPAALHDPGKIVEFGFRDARGRGFWVAGLWLGYEAATDLIRTRMDEFSWNPGSRESFRQKVVRKWLAAHGLAWISGLREQLDHDEAMELEMMLSPDSHTSTATRAESAKLLKDVSTERLSVDEIGHIAGEQPGYLVDQSGTEFLQL